MSEEPNPYAAPSSPIGRTRPSVRRPSPVGPYVYLIGWSWPFVLMMCGVARDRVHISTRLKIALTVGCFLVPVLVTRYGGRSRFGCAALLGAYCLFSVVLIWFVH